MTFRDKLRLSRTFSRNLLLGVVGLVILAAPPASAKTLRVDCEASKRSGALTSLSGLDRRKLVPGDRVLLRRGTECVGRLKPRGSGSARRPVVIGAYGRGALPVIAGTGANAVLLRHFNHVVLRDLEITNPGDGSTKKRGVHVVAKRASVRGTTIRDLYIHDVGGDLSKDAGGSGGIQVSTLGYGIEPPVRFLGLRILRNRIEEVSRSGIFVVGTTDGDRPRATEPWPAASRRVVIRGNRIDGIAGDGIVPLGTDGALVEHNVVSDGNRAGRAVADPAGMICNAGIWTFHANNTRIRFNEVFGMNLNGCDGTGYDIDYDQDGTVVEFNLSHHNEGGFMLLCTDTGPRTAEVRFNLSVDDAYALQESPCQGVPTGFEGSLDGIRMYNNTWVGPNMTVQTPALVPIPGPVNTGSFEFRNNVMVATAPQAEPFGCGTNCSHNLFHRMPPSGTDFVVGDPRFVDAGRRGFGRLPVGEGFKLLEGSPAIRAGIAIPGGGTADYFGAPVTDPPAIGFHQP